MFGFVVYCTVLYCTCLGLQVEGVSVKAMSVDGKFKKSLVLCYVSASSEKYVK